MTGPTPIFDELRVRLARTEPPAPADDRPSGTHARGDRSVLELLRARRDGADGAPTGPLRVLSFARPAPVER